MWLDGVVNIWDYISRSMIRWQTEDTNIHDVCFSSLPPRILRIKPLTDTAPGR